MDNGNGNENGHWRQKIKKLNLAYLNIVRQIGAIPEQRGYVQTALGLDGDMIQLLMSLDPEVLPKVADVGATLFRLRLTDLKSADNLHKKGNGDRAASFLTAALAADGNNGQGGEA